jgi:uncharacterized protein
MLSHELNEQLANYRSLLNCMNIKCQILDDVDLEQLETAGILGVLLDLDNTIVSEDDQYLSPGAELWIEAAKHRGIQLCILSNGKRKYRVNYWADRLSLPAISPAYKPFPNSFRHAIAQMKLRSDQTVVIGDSFHTDILGAWIVGISSVHVASLPHRKHWWESLFGKFLHFSLLSNIQLEKCDIGKSVV